MEKIKVLHLAPANFRGGIHSYIFNHYKYMDRDKFQFDFLTQNKELRYAEEYKEFQYGVVELITTARENKDLFAQEIERILRNNYDILHLHTSFWTGFLIEEIAMNAGVGKVIVHAHSSFIEENDSRKRAKLLEQHEKIKKEFTQEYATDFWAGSKVAADWLFGEQIPREKIKYLKNAIELERFRYNEEKRKKIQEKLVLENEVVLGTVGRLTYQKNHFFLLDVFEQFHKKYENSKLIIVGNGELEHELKQKIREKNLENVVIMAGWKEDRENYLQVMDCFLFPSRFEGYPIALLEAMASGLPCVTSDTITEEIEFCDYVKRVPCIKELWEEAIEEMLFLDNNRLWGEQILSAEGFDIRKQAKYLEKLYEE